jgi:xeroderma pigmentosum group C-complementing protein
MVPQGKIPKNGFGNIDLFTPTMLPPGAVHLPCESILGWLFFSTRPSF